MFKYSLIWINIQGAGRTTLGPLTHQEPSKSAEVTHQAVFEDDPDPLLGLGTNEKRNRKLVSYLMV